MTAKNSGGASHGIPGDERTRQKIRDGLSDDERNEFDEIVEKIDNGQKPNRDQRKIIRKWQQQGKVKIPSKKFKSRSDKKTHQDP